MQSTIVFRLITDRYFRFDLANYMLNKSFFLIFVLSGGFFFTAFAQQPQLRWYQEQDGLPSNMINSIVQTESGEILFAGHFGIAVFDGEEFVMYGTRDGLPETGIGHAQIDHKGRVWLHGFSGTLSYYYQDSIYTIFASEELKKDGYIGRFFIGNNDTISIYYQLNRKINMVVPDGNGDWTEVKESERLSGAVLEVKHYDDSGKLLTPIVADEFDTDSVRINYVLNGVDGEFAVHAPGPWYRLASAALVNHSYMIFDQYVIQFHEDKGAVLYEGPSQLNYMYEDRVGNFWIGAEGHGMLCFGGADLTKPPITYTGEHELVSVFQDNEGGYWFNTNGDGIAYWSPDNIWVFQVGAELTESGTTFMIEFNDTLIIGHSNGQIGWYNSVTGQEELLPFSDDPSGTYVADITIYQDELYALAWGSFGGCYKYERLNQNWQRISEVGGASFVNIDNALFIMMPDSGAYQVKNNRLLLDTNSGLHEGINAEHAIKYREETYYGAWQGLYKKVGDTVLPVSEKLPFTALISAFLILESGELVVSTFGSGIAVLNTNDTLYFDQTNGLHDDLVNSVFQDADGDIWIATAAGMGVYRLAGDQLVLIRKFLGSELPDYDVWYFHERGDEMFVLSSKGISVLNKSCKTLNRTPVKFTITGVTVNGKNKAPGTLHLSYGQYQVEIHGHRIAFAPYACGLFKYRILELDTNWSTTSTSSIVLHNLSSGSYTFEMVSLDNLGRFNSPVQQTSFSIALPVWRQWWFIGLSILLFVAVSWLGIRAITNRKSLKARQEIEMLQLRREALNAQLNPHFVFNALNSIQKFILKNERDDAAHYLSKFARLIRLTLENSGKDMVTLAEELSLVQLYLELEKLRFKDKLTYHIQVDEHLSPDMIEVPILLLQVYIENAIWHGIKHKAEGGKVIVSVSKIGDNRVEIVIEDDGVGRKLSRQLKTDAYLDRESMGMGLNERRIANMNLLHKRDIKVVITDLQKPNGTRVQIIMNVG